MSFTAQVLEPSFNRLSFPGEEQASGLQNLKSSSEILLFTKLHFTELSLGTMIAGKLTEVFTALQNSIQPLTFCLEAVVKAENECGVHGVLV